MLQVENTTNELQVLGGRKYHANSKIAYLMPEDADGKSTIKVTNTLLNAYVDLLIY